MRFLWWQAGWNHSVLPQRRCQHPRNRCYQRRMRCSEAFKMTSNPYWLGCLSWRRPRLKRDSQMPTWSAAIITTNLMNLHSISGRRIGNCHRLVYTSLMDILLVLDPRISYTILKDYANNSALDAYLELAKQDLHEYYMAHYAPTPNQPTQSLATSTASIIGGGGPRQHSPQKSFTAWYKKATSTATNELEQYYQYPQEDFDHCDPLQWWYKCRQDMPNLYQLAWDLMTIPGKHFLIISCSLYSYLIITRICHCGRAYLLLWEGLCFSPACEIIAWYHPHPHARQASSL